VTHGTLGIKYSDIDEKWWVDVVLQDAPPAIRREKIGEQVVTDGFESVTGPVLVRKGEHTAHRLTTGPARRR